MSWNMVHSALSLCCCTGYRCLSISFAFCTQHWSGISNKIFMVYEMSDRVHRRNLVETHKCPIVFDGIKFLALQFVDHKSGSRNVCLLCGRFTESLQIEIVHT